MHIFRAVVQRLARIRRFVHSPVIEKSVAAPVTLCKLLKECVLHKVIGLGDINFIMLSQPMSPPGTCVMCYCFICYCWIGKGLKPSHIA